MSGLRSLCGGRLKDGSPVRYVYVDEAGTAAQEPVSVVVGIVVHADSQLRAVTQYLDFLRCQHVPPEIRDGYIFHATDLYSGGKHRQQFPLERRLRLLHRLLSTPRKFHLQVAYAYKRRQPEESGERDAQNRHAFAFAMCIKEASDFIRHSYTSEVATVIAENCTHMQQRLRDIPKKMSKNKAFLGNDPLDVIMDAPHFVSKQESPLLQLADACAFAIRRDLSGLSRGGDLVSKITGGRQLVLNRDALAGNGIMVSPGSALEMTYRQWRAPL